MPVTEVLLYQELDGTIPVLDWLKELRRKNRWRLRNVCFSSTCWKSMAGSCGDRGRI
jgi:hypothetical protein